MNPVTAGWTLDHMLLLLVVIALVADGAEITWCKTETTRELVQLLPLSMGCLKRQIHMMHKTSYLCCEERCSRDTGPARGSRPCPKSSLESRRSFYNECRSCTPREMQHCCKMSTEACRRFTTQIESWNYDEILHALLFSCNAKCAFTHGMLQFMGLGYVGPRQPGW